MVSRLPFVASVPLVLASNVLSGCGGAVATESNPPVVDAGSAAQGSLDCEWLTGENCWNAMASEIASCVRPDRPFGKFSSDRQSCTYDDGRRISFGVAPPVSLDVSFRLAFSITRADGECLRVEELPQRQVRVTTPTRTVIVDYTNNPLQLTVTCPNAERFVLYDRQSLECNGNPTEGPWIGKTWGSPGGSFQADLTGAGLMPELMFLCE
jgi:hypothetical protein